LTFGALKDMSKILASPEFGAMERYSAQVGLMTSRAEPNVDILRNLTENNRDTFSKITNLPIVKNVLKQTDKNAEFLFGKLQRFMKVYSFWQRKMEWLADHGEDIKTKSTAELIDVQNEAVRAADVGFAKHVNSVYGGLNWEAMGFTKSNVSLLRLAFLAPDWTISNIQLLTGAAKGGTYGSSS